MKELSSWPDDTMASSAKKLLEQHEVGTVVVTCMDFRFRKQLPNAIFLTFGVEDYDEIKLAGGAKNIVSPDKEGRQVAVFDDIRIALEKHRAKKIILLTHQNCGKYAAEGYVFTDPEAERIFHEKELRLAGDITFSRFMDAEILLGYAWVDPEEKILIDRIKSSVAG